MRVLFFSSATLFLIAFAMGGGSVHAQELELPADDAEASEATTDAAPDDDEAADTAAETLAAERAAVKAKEEEEKKDQWSDRVVDDGLERLKRPVDRLLEQTIGSTSRPVGFDWRDSWVQIGVTGSELIERNNFGSFRVGLMARKAFSDFMVEGAVNYVFVFATPSSRLLALTPYRQAGRPERFEIDVNVSYPLAEGVVTPLFDWFPPMELVLSVTGAGRYLLYPRVLAGDRDWGDINTYTNTQTFIDIGQSLATPSLSEADQLIMDRYVLGGMLLDPARIQALAGITFDVYMQPGLFLTTRALIGLPVLNAVSGSMLSFWSELSITLGYAF